MCTLILAWQVFDGTPVAAGANRDEALGRPSAPPRVLDEDPRVVAPQDEEAGGTWIGYNDEGLFVAVTNRRSDREVRRASEGGSGDEPRPDGERSRGLLVRDALARPNATAAGEFVRDELADREYAGFNLVVADAEEAGLLEWDGVLRATHFDPGVHVVVNEGHDAAAPKASRIREAARPTSERDVEGWFDHVAEVLRDHDLDACVHGEVAGSRTADQPGSTDPGGGFGTRSSSLVAVDADGGEGTDASRASSDRRSDGDARYWFADGRPCETDYEVVEIGDEADRRGRSERA